MQDRIYGRVACDDIYQPGDKTKIFARSGDLIFTSKHNKLMLELSLLSLDLRLPVSLV